MKIALVSPYDFTWPGGVTAHISQLRQYLTAMGHEIKILAPYSPSRSYDSDPDFVPLGRSVPIPSGGSIARISLSAWLYRRIRDILNEEEFDIIHIHEPLSSFLPLSVLQSSKSVNIATFHSFQETKRWYFFCGSAVLKHWFKRLDNCIAVSPAAEKHIGRYFPHDYKIIPNGIDLNHFNDNVEPLPEFCDEKLNILFVGRLEKRKGLKYLLDAYSRLKWDFPLTRLIVVGPGNIDKDCHRILSERNLKDVVFLHNVPYTELPRYYKSAQIFCTPATGKESFGIVLLEAMATGVPIVASHIEGYSNIITHGKQGLLVPPSNGETLANALTLLIRDPELRKSMSLQGISTATKYRWELVAKKVEELYQTTLEAKNGSKN